ncbi:MAG: hypothetical protein OSB09_11600 [Planctomycetota bacterium]|nr:hypothetical protein [Planctomycetota bacterium]
MFSSSSSSFFQAISILAVILSGIAIYFSQLKPTELIPVQTGIRSSNSEPLEQSIAALRGELISMQLRLDSLELAALDKSKPGQSPDAEVAGQQDLDSRIVVALDRVMESKGLEYAEVAQQEAEAQRQQKKLQQSRDGFAKWVDHGRAKLPNLYNRIRDDLDLAPQTAFEVEEILENGYQTMAFLTEQLYTDPPPEGLDATAIMGEVKQEAGSIIQDLGQILTPGEMIALGQVYSEEVDPRLGQGIISNGKEGDHEEETQN